MYLLLNMFVLHLAEPRSPRGRRDCDARGLIAGDPELKGAKLGDAPRHLLISLFDVTSFSAHKIFMNSLSEPHASSLFSIICKLPCELHPGSIKSSGRWLERAAA